MNVLAASLFANCRKSLELKGNRRGNEENDGQGRVVCPLRISNSQSLNK